MRTFARRLHKPRRPASFHETRSKTVIPAVDHPVPPILRLQQSIGNQAVQRLIRQARPDVLEARPRTKEVARFAQQALKLIQRQPGSGVETNASELTREMQRQIDLWQGACQNGIDDFVFGALEKRIDSLSEGSWSKFFITLLGNLIWAGAAFTSGGAAVGISLAGVLIGAVPQVPHKGKKDDDLHAIAKQMRTYIENIHKQLNDVLPTKAAAILADHPKLALDPAVELFLNASFKPEMIEKSARPLVGETAVRQKMEEEAQYVLDLMEVTKEAEMVEVYTDPGVPHRKGKYRVVAWIDTPISPPGYPQYEPKLALVDVDPGNVYDTRPKLADVTFVRWIPSGREDSALETQKTVTGRVPTYAWNIVKGLAPIRFPAK